MRARLQSPATAKSSGPRQVRTVGETPARAQSAARSPRSAGEAFLAYFRTPAELAILSRGRSIRTPRNSNIPAFSEEAGYFRFGEAICYGRRRGGPVTGSILDALPDATADGRPHGLLPFDLTEVVRNLRQERYARRAFEGSTSAKTTRKAYYFLRPVLSVPVRKHLQKIRLSGWQRIPFPRWPLDVSVEKLMQETMRRLIESRGGERIPFIWFWPDGAPSCAMMTHDVEGASGRAFCERLMDADESFGITSAFQIIPEVASRGTRQPQPSLPSRKLVDEIRSRGFEVNLHDLNHDGRLFEDRRQFLERAARINDYAREYDCRGFRSGAMYREQEWFDAFEFSFDMSVPNVAHLEPQRGGCCTVMPYFIGRILELPLTTIQDYSLFHIVGDYSIDLWREQIELIRAEHGLISFIGHPDYLRHTRALKVYTELLAHVADLRARKLVWMALPSEIDAWWRNRQHMSLVADGDSWRIVGAGSERARVAYARLDGNRVAYTVSERS
jgi:hypothetical protein